MGRRDGEKKRTKEIGKERGKVYIHIVAKTGDRHGQPPSGAPMGVEPRDHNLLISDIVKCPPFSLQGAWFPTPGLAGQC